MAIAPKNKRDSKGLYVQDGMRKVYITNPRAWRASNGGDVVIVRIPSWGPTWTATWRESNDSGQAMSTLITWLTEHGTKSSTEGKNVEESYEEGLIFRKLLCSSVRECIEEDGRLSSAGIDAYVAQYNACVPTESKFKADDIGHYIKEGSSKTYLPDALEQGCDAYLFRFGLGGRVRVITCSYTRDDALEAASDWLVTHFPKYAPDPELPFKSGGKLRMAMRRQGFTGRFDDLAGCDQDKIVEVVSKDFIETHSGYFPKGGVKEKRLKAGVLLRKAKELSNHMEDHDEADEDDTEALAQLYGRQSSRARKATRAGTGTKKKRRSKRRPSAPGSRSRTSSRSKTAPKKKPQRKLIGVVQRD